MTVVQSKNPLNWLVRASVLAVLLQGAPGWSDTVTVDASMSNQTLEGWGTPLSWFANSVGGWTNVKNQASLMNALFNPLSGLGLTYLRYNIGGGDNPNCAAKGGCITPVYHATPGYLAGPGGKYDWTRDADQRRVAKYAQLFGANLFEAISYSPPYWMTVSGTSKGGVDGAPNLASQYFGAGKGSFADYLATVAEHFSDSFGITFHHLDAMNEPGQTWWTSTDTKQEGCGFSLPEQEETVENVQNSLSGKSLLTQIAAMDENAEGVLNASPKTTANEFYNYDSTVKTDMTALNTHAYSSAYGSVAIATSALHYGKRVTMSEWGSGDSTGKDLSNQIVADMYLTRPVAWSIWQPDYPALMTIDYVNQAYTLNEGYYVYGNYTKFIRPGFQFVAISDPQSLAAFDQRTRTLVIVTQNWTANNRSVTYQLTNFTTPGSTASVYRPSATENLKLLGKVSLSNGSFDYTANVGSVTTYVIENASYTPPATTVSGNAYQSKTTNDFYTVQFSGQQARVYGSMAPHGGVAAFSVDNGAETYFDTYAPLPTDNVFLFATPTLANTGHTLKVRVTGLKNPYSFGYRVSANRVDIVSGAAVGQGIYEIVNVNNGLDLEVNSASLADGGTVDTYVDVPGANNEHWNLMAVGDGSYRIVNVNSGLDLEANGASKSNGGIVNQWQDSGSGATNEHWNLIAVGDGSYRIVNVNSGLEMEVNGTTGAVDQYQDVPGAKNERWNLTPTN